MAKRDPRMWTVPHIWDGTCAILGGGPSLCLIPPEDLAVLKNVRTIAVNCAYLEAPFADVMFFADESMLLQNGKGLAHFGGLKLTTNDKYLNRSDLHVLHIRGGFGLSTDPRSVIFNRSSGGTAVNIATLLGAKRILLFGFDMRRWSAAEVLEKFGTDDKRRQLNYHARYREPSDKKNPYPGFLLPFDNIALDLKKQGVECINATPGSMLMRFPMRDPIELLEEIRREHA